jgi:ABC-2 type transport system permease protein
MGILSGNQMAAIANMKFLFLLVSGSVLGAILIPAGRHYFLYWSPFYWSTIGFIKIITNEITWPLTGRYCLWIISLTFAVFLALKNRIRKGLS